MKKRDFIILGAILGFVFPTVVSIFLFIANSLGLAFWMSDRIFDTFMYVNFLGIGLNYVLIKSGIMKTSISCAAGDFWCSYGMRLLWSSALATLALSCALIGAFLGWTVFRFTNPTKAKGR